MWNWLSRRVPRTKATKKTEEQPKTAGSKTPDTAQNTVFEKVTGTPANAGMKEKPLQWKNMSKEQPGKKKEDSSDHTPGTVFENMAKSPVNTGKKEDLKRNESPKDKKDEKSQPSTTKSSSHSKEEKKKDEKKDEKKKEKKFNDKTDGDSVDCDVSTDCDKTESGRVESEQPLATASETQTQEDGGFTRSEDSAEDKKSEDKLFPARSSASSEEQTPKTPPVKIAEANADKQTTVFENVADNPANAGMKEIKLQWRVEKKEEAKSPGTPVSTPPASSPPPENKGPKKQLRELKKKIMKAPQLISRRVSRESKNKKSKNQSKETTTRHE